MLLRVDWLWVCAFHGGAVADRVAGAQRSLGGQVKGTDVLRSGIRNVQWTATGRWSVPCAWPSIKMEISPYEGLEVGGMGRGGLAHTYEGPLQQRRVNDIMISGEKLMGWSRSVVCKWSWVIDGWPGLVVRARTYLIEIYSMPTCLLCWPPFFICIISRASCDHESYFDKT